MQRRGASKQPVKGQSHRTIRPKTRKAPTAHLSNADLQEQLDRAMRERDDALEQQAATSEVLQVISSSTGNLEPVFQAMLENALRICEAKFGTLFRFDGKAFHRAAGIGVPSALAELQKKRGPYLPESGTLLDRVLQTGEVAHSSDYAAEPIPGNAAKLGGARSTVAVPMLKNSELVGAIIIYRQEVRPFTDKQIELVQNFAVQAVIAIENTRLLNELRQRTDDLSESLEQQTATSEVLQVISSSRGELEPVFDAMLANATRICEAKFGTLYLRDGDGFHAVAATRDAPPAYVEARKRDLRIQPSRDGPLGCAAITKQVAHVADMMELQSYRDGSHPRFVEAVELGKFRTALGVPMLKDDELIGVITILRQEVRPFTEKQIELVKNFAAQAVIAIENTRLLKELRQRSEDLSESLEQQTATSEVLSVISSSPGELQPIFNTMLAKASELCEASYGLMWLSEGNAFRTAALLGDLPQAYVDLWRSGTLFRPGPHVLLSRVAISGQPLQVADLRTDASYLSGDPLPVAAADIAGVRTLLVVPMVRDKQVVGAIGIYRKEIKPFTDKQIELVTNFAAQSVIAIENARLLSELRESLQQQTATADVLKVISSSPGELEPVFQAMLENATRICDAKFGNIYRWDGDSLRLVATHNTPPAYAQLRGSLPFRPGLETPTGRMLATKSVTHVADLALEPGYVERDPLFVEGVEVGGIRTLLSVPMVKENELIGAFSIYRDEVRPFTDKQIELVQNFAAQAVIAIENTHLLNELRESLQQQTATSKVLQVINSSSGELAPVFGAMLENATRICGASYGTMFICEGTRFRTAAMYNLPRALAEGQGAGSGLIEPIPDDPLGQLAATKQKIHISDARTESAYKRGFAPFVELVDDGGARTLLVMPLLREDELTGAFAIYRQEVRPFTDKQIELVQNFAAQAVIAIENARLLSELRESLQQQTATADVLKAISRSTFDLHTVLQTLVESAARLCDADKTIITRQKEGGFYRAEAYGLSREFMDYVKDVPIKAERGSAFGRSLLEGLVVHIPDVKADPEYTWVEAQRLGDYRTVLTVPMLREGVAIGVLSLARSEVRPFTDKQIELATTFADQAAIAIENVRLFESVEARTRELAKSLEDLRTAQDRLVQTEKLASLGQLTAGIAHEIKNPLNFVNNFSGVSAELIDELQDTLKGISLDNKARAEITEITSTLRGNLEKVVQHGKRADAIVKNMLLHSRAGSGEHRPVDINALVEESLNLAWHGARAEKQGFNITLEKSFDPTAGEADIFPQDITRVLLNLISNGFYAATKRKAETNGGNYEPTLAAATTNLGNRVEIRIRDNGTGIPPEVKKRLFTPFFTTKPAGEGTGLGLSISHDIIVKQHGGSIEVETLPGEFTEFRIILPRKAATIAKLGERA